MRLLEYESKEILREYQIAVPRGQIISSTEQLDVDAPVILKVQIPMGGRAKVGGILEASTTEEAKAAIEQLLSTTVRGYKANRILMEEKIDVAQEFFMAIVYNTVAKAPAALFSLQGGVDIEELATLWPEKVRKRLFSVCQGFLPYQAREIISETGISRDLLVDLSLIFSKLGDIFLRYDATTTEINPLALTQDGQLIALDCHLEIDDDALFRHSDFAKIEEDKSRFEGRKSSEFERRAVEVDSLDHRGVAGRVIEFDGPLGLIIGGGGASLTAFDAILKYGGMPANYCEIGGNPSVRKVKELTKLILSRRNVKKISVIMNVVSNTRVDLVARGVVKGILEAGKAPSETIAVFRVPGAWEEEGFKILSKYGVSYCDRNTSIDAAAKIAVARTKANDK